METYLISEAKPRLGELVRQAAGGKVIYLLHGKDRVALVPVGPTHDPTPDADAGSVNRRLAAAERTPVETWNPGDARRLAKQLLRQKTPQ